MLEELPVCCSASADCLDRQRAIYEADGVFSARMVDGIIRSLKDFDDTNLIAEANKDVEKMQALVRRFFHCG